MTSKNKIYFYIEEGDKPKYIGLSLFLRKKYPDYIDKCFKFSLKNEIKYAVNISVKSTVSKEVFDNITTDILGHFGKEFLIYYKTGDETGDKKYTFSNMKPKMVIKKHKKYSFVPDE